MRIVELEEPSAGFCAGNVSSPVGDERALLRKQPLRGALRRVMRRGDSTFRQRMQRDSRIPYRREARLNTNAIPVLDEEIFQLLVGALHALVIVGIAQASID